MSLPFIFSRFRSQLAPRRINYIKRHKGIIPVPIGGSTKGTTLSYGEWGIRIKGPGVRLTAKQLTSAEEAIKRKIKTLKGAKVFMRVFPDIPVCLKVRVFLSRETLYHIHGFLRETRPVWERGRVLLSSGLRGM